MPLCFDKFNASMPSIKPIVVVVVCVLLGLNNAPAFAHFFGGTTVSIDDKYQVVFLPYPSSPIAGSNSTTLNFSVLENNTNIYNIHSALVITDKSTGNIVGQFPYRLYEFSDITVPYTFEQPGEYSVSLQTRIVGDEKYQVMPLVASFDLTVEALRELMPIDQLMLYYVTPAAVAIAAVAIYLDSRKKA